MKRVESIEFWKKRKPFDSFWTFLLCIKRRSFNGSTKGSTPDPELVFSAALEGKQEELGVSVCKDEANYLPVLPKDLRRLLFHLCVVQFYPFNRVLKEKTLSFDLLNNVEFKIPKGT